MFRINDIFIDNAHIVEEGRTDREFVFPDKEVIPGFIDSHTHFIQYGIKKQRLDLSEVRKRENIFEIVRNGLKREREEEILIAEDWDESNWKNREFPRKGELDRISKDEPIILRRVCGHIAVANQKALSLIPKGWEIVDYKSGILEEDAVLCLNEIFPPSVEILKKSIIEAQKYFFKLGITSISDIQIPEYFRVCQQLERENKLRISIHAFITEKHLEEVEDLRSTPRVKLAGIKIFMDGSIGARTAALDDYIYHSGDKGMLLRTEKRLRELIPYANSKEYQLAIHAIGDRAISEVLNAMDINNPDNIRRHRIEHFELATDKQIKEAVRKNLILSMQPNFLKWSVPGGLYENVLEKNFEKNNRFSKLKNEGGTIAFGSDGMPYGPLYGIECIQNTTFSEQRIDKEAAMEAYTSGGAFASFREDEVGKLKKGMKADIAVIDKDGVYLTLKEGRIEYSREEEFPEDI